MECTALEMPKILCILNTFSKEAEFKFKEEIIMVVQHNLTAMNSNRQLGITSALQAKSSEKLSSGFKINRAADDAAGLTISEKMRSQVRGLNRASANAQDGISLIQVAEGALNETHSILQRMNELATQGANDTNTDDDRNAIKSELDELVKEIDRISNTTTFNTQVLLNGEFDDKAIQVGAKAGDDEVIKISIKQMSKEGLGLDDDNTIDSNEGGQTRMSSYQEAIKQVSEQRSNLGALQNRLEHTVLNIDNISENTQAAESRIRDTNVPKEMVEFSKNNILTQAGQAMLAQANQSTQGVLSLLR